MSRTPIFPDCQFITDCQCAARGYEHEKTSCAVDRVAQAAAMLGMPLEIIFGLTDHVEDSGASNGVNFRGAVVVISTRVLDQSQADFSPYRYVIDHYRRMRSDADGAKILHAGWGKWDDPVHDFVLTTTVRDDGQNVKTHLWNRGERIADAMDDDGIAFDLSTLAMMTMMASQTGQDDDEEDDA